MLISLHHVEVVDLVEWRKLLTFIVHHFSVLRKPLVVVGHCPYIVGSDLDVFGLGICLIINLIRLSLRKSSLSTWRSRFLLRH